MFEQSTSTGKQMNPESNRLFDDLVGNFRLRTGGGGGGAAKQKTSKAATPIAKEKAGKAYDDSSWVDEDGQKAV